MAFTVIELEYINPPVLGSIFAVPIDTPENAFELWKWAVDPDNSEFTCTMIAPVDGVPTIQVSGRTSPTVTSPIGGDRWIVYNSGKLTVFETRDEALTIYKVKTP